MYDIFTCVYYFHQVEDKFFQVVTFEFDTSWTATTQCSIPPIQSSVRTIKRIETLYTFHLITIQGAAETHINQEYCEK